MHTYSTRKGGVFAHAPVIVIVSFLTTSSLIGAIVPITRCDLARLRYDLRVRRGCEKQSLVRLAERKINELRGRCTIISEIMHNNQ